MSTRKTLSMEGIPMHFISRPARCLFSFLVLASLICLAVSSGVSSEVSFDTHDVTSPGQAGFQPVDSPPGPHTAITPEWTIFTGAPMLSSPKTADLQGDGPREIILTTYAPGVDPYAYGQVFVLDADGNDLPGWPIQTPGPIPATAAIGDLDNNGVSEIVVGCWDQMHVFQLDGSEMPGWPKTASVTQAAALEDLDGDGDLEILFPVSTGLYIFQHDGTFLPGWPRFAPDLMGSPALANLDGDPDLEIVAGTYQGPVGPETFEVYAWNLDGTVLDGFPVTTSGVNKVPPALGDIDNDGMVEIVIPSYHTSDLDYLYAFDGTGAAEPGWPVRGERIRLSPPSLADIDGDGDLEIFTAGADVITLDGYLYGFDHTGASLPSFPITLNRSQVNSSPVVSNTHGSAEEFEVFVKNKDYFFGYHTDGSSILDFPFFLSDANHTGTTSPTPCLDDLDGDGDIEAIFAATFNQVAMVDFADAVDPGDLHWPTYKQDPQNRSYFEPSTSSSVPQITAGAVDPLRIWPNPASTSVRLAVDIGEGAPPEISILDPSGRRVRSLSDGGSSVATWDGRDDNGRPVASGIYTILLGGHQSTARRLVWIR
jgi:hypothetical protein